MKRISWVLCCVLLGSLAGAAPPGAKPGDKPIWLVVTRPMFVEALKPLIGRRANEGFEAAVSTESPDKALAGLRHRPAFVVLVGDDQPGGAGKPWFVPARRMKLYRWQGSQGETFASDMAWGDLDGDDAPDVPVSRLPAQTVDQVTLMVDKIAAWEDRPASVDDLSISVWAGAAMYNEFVDSLATAILLTSVQASSPPWAPCGIISSDRGSPLCGWPDDQPAMFEERVRRGGFFNFMIGHGDIVQFVGMPGSGYSAGRPARAFGKGPPAAPLLILACHCGNFASGFWQCLTKAMVLAPGGPVAAIGATTVSHPLPNYFSGQCFLSSLGAPGEGRIGTLWLASERRAAQMRQPLVERILRDVEGALEDQIDLVKLRRDQTLMYALLGDGATRLRRVEPMTVKVERAGDRWRWQAERPADALELHVGFRPSEAATIAVKVNPDREQARKSFDEANAAFAFIPLAKLPAREKWEGTVDKPGTLRLVAVAPGKLYVATEVLKRPTPPPTTPAKTPAPGG